MNESWILFKRNLRDFWKVFRRNRMGLVGAFLVFSAILLAIFAPLLTGYQPTEVIRDADGRGMTYAPPRRMARWEPTMAGAMSGRSWFMARAYH